MLGGSDISVELDPLRFRRKRPFESFYSWNLEKASAVGGSSPPDLIAEDLIGPRLEILRP